MDNFIIIMSELIGIEIDEIGKLKSAIWAFADMYDFN